MLISETCESSSERMTSRCLVMAQNAPSGLSIAVTRDMYPIRFICHLVVEMHYFAHLSRSRILCV